MLDKIDLIAIYVLSDHFSVYKSTTPFYFLQRFDTCLRISLYYCNASDHEAAFFFYKSFPSRTITSPGRKEWTRRERDV